MGLVATNTLHPLTARERSSPSIPSSSPRHIANDGEELLPCTSEAPDPTYWTAYDYYMVERDARAGRRAYIYSLIATFAKWLRQRMFSN